MKFTNYNNLRKKSATFPFLIFTEWCSNTPQVRWKSLTGLHCEYVGARSLKIYLCLKSYDTSLTDGTRQLCEWQYTPCPIKNM